MLGPGSRKRQCYRETSGLRCGRERECGHGRRGAGPIWRPLMRVYIINADDLIVSREAPAHLSENEIVVASLDELRAARLSGKRLLTLWNGLPGVERLSKVGDRETLIELAGVSDGFSFRPCGGRLSSPGCRRRTAVTSTALHAPT